MGTGAKKEKTSRSGPAEEKSKVDHQGVSTKFCSSVCIQQNSLCNMTLWKALALLAMMVPAVVAKSNMQPR